MFYGDELSKISSGSDVWTGRCNIKRKYSEKDAYRDINGVYRNRGYYLTFNITFTFDEDEREDEKLIRKLINKDEVTFIERDFEPYALLSGTAKPIAYTGKLKLKKEESEPTFDIIEVEMIIELEDINETHYVVSEGEEV